MLLLNPLSAAAALLALSAEAAKPRDAILLSQVESLTLRGDRQTSHRRVPAAPQLRCISRPPLCARYTVDVMRCENKGAGYDSEDIQWSCTAQLPPELKLGSTDVTCEGYSGPDDPYVLKGSCGVEYRLALTPEGEERWPDLAGGGGGGDTIGLEGAGVWFVYLFWAVFFAVAGWIAYSAWNEYRQNRRGGAGWRVPRRPPRHNDNNGGGGGGGWDDPPPPYPGTGGGGSGSGGYTRKTEGGSPSSSGNGGNNWQTGLLSGAAGAAAGYYMGSRGNNTDNNHRNYGSTWGNDSSSGGAWPSRSSGSSSGSSSRPSSRPAASSTRYESTGFGSTSRR